MGNSGQIRQISNKINIIKIIVSSIIWVLCLLGVLCYKDYYPNIILVLTIIFLIVLVFSVLDYWIVKNTNEVLKNLPYGFDYQNELYIYSIIGRNSKKPKNGVQKFSKYSDWKKYLEKEYSMHMKCDDFYRFLKRMLRNKKNYRDLLTIIVVPIEIAFLTIFYGANKTMSEIEITLSLFILTLFFVLFLSVNILNAREEVNFLKDYIEVLYGNKKYRKKHHSIL